MISNQPYPILNAKSGETLRGMSVDRMIDLTHKGGFPAYRAKQLFHWIYRQGARSLDEMTNLPQTYRAFLKSNFELGGLKIEAIRGKHGKTQKIVYRCNDGEMIEGVLMPEKGRLSLCVSTQVGCALGCTFCLTGHGGFRRDLSVDEIVDQVLLGKCSLSPERRIDNVVLMGMGEALINLENVLPALRLITAPQGIAVSTRRVTVSTVGIPDGIRALGREDLGINLAVSLNATTNEVRSRLMPINKKFPLESVLQACREFPSTHRRRMTFEYVLLKGVNDSAADARRFSRLLHDVHSKINLIVFNPHSLLPFDPSEPKAMEDFRTILSDKHHAVSLRRSKGGDIGAACGLLAGHYFRPKDS